MFGRTMVCMYSKQIRPELREQLERESQDNRIAATQYFTDQAKAIKDTSHAYFTVTKEYLHGVGLQWWPVTYKHQTADDDVLAQAALLRHWATYSPGDMFKLYDPMLGFLYLACARWADCAFPIVQLAGHKYAAALMSTAVPDVPIKPPWDSFLIYVPDGLLYTENSQGDRCGIYMIQVWHHTIAREGKKLEEKGWSFHAYSKGAKQPPTLQRYSMPIQEFASFETQGIDGDPEPDGAYRLPIGDQDSRTIWMISRLVLNTCLAMSNPEEVRQVGKRPQGWERGPYRESPEPLFRIFQTGHPVKVDCRPALDLYLQGQARKPQTVQFLVRGHWRNQACGPNLSDRRMTWISPHWKGPEDAPINQRSHILAKT